MGEAKSQRSAKIHRLYALQNEGKEYRDAQRSNGPYHPETLEGVQFRTGYLIRDLFLALCVRDNDYAKQAIASGQLSAEQFASEIKRRETLN